MLCSPSVVHVSTIHMYLGIASFLRGKYRFHAHGFRPRTRIISHCVKMKSLLSFLCTPSFHTCMYSFSPSPFFFPTSTLPSPTIYPPPNFPLSSLHFPTPTPTPLPSSSLPPLHFTLLPSLPPSLFPPQLPPGGLWMYDVYREQWTTA